MLKVFLLVVIIACIPHCMFAQPTSGCTGLLNIPTADMQLDGTFIMGGNYLPEDITPATFSYNTGNYFLNFTFLPFWEVTYRMTLFKMEQTGRYTNQDRSIGLRMRVLKEQKFLPAVVLGGNDLYTTSTGNHLYPTSSTNGNQYFGTIYLVGTKSLIWNENQLALTLGYGFRKALKGQISGIFGGIAYSPEFYRNLKIMAEYDGRAMNAGASVLVFNHLYLQAFAYDLKHLMGGLSYRMYLKKRERRVQEVTEPEIEENPHPDSYRAP